MNVLLLSLLIKSSSFLVSVRTLQAGHGKCFTTAQQSTSQKVYTTEDELYNSSTVRKHLMALVAQFDILTAVPENVSEKKVIMLEAKKWHKDKQGCY